MPSKAPLNNPPRTDDSLAPPRGTREALVVDPITALVDNFLAVAYDVGPDAKVQYEAALADLKKKANQVIVAIARAEASCPRSDYPRRWALIYAASQLNHNSALTFLRDFIATPIPPERSADPRSFSTVGEETVLRTTAVEGIGRLAGKGNKQALQALIDFLSIQSLSIRRAAVHAILSRSQRLRKRVADHLPFIEKQDLKGELKTLDSNKSQEIKKIKEERNGLKRSLKPLIWLKWGVCILIWLLILLVTLFLPWYSFSEVKKLILVISFLLGAISALCFPVGKSKTISIFTYICLLLTFVSSFWGLYQNQNEKHEQPRAA